MGSGSALDPLGSQGSLVLTDNGKWLLAVNAGSNNITVFAVEKDGLTFMDKVGSGGVMPVSLTVSGNEVFVLNAGGTPNISGFMLSHKGDLEPVAGSTRTLAAGGYAQVGFTPDGDQLVITNKAGNNILVFALNSRGMPANSAVKFTLERGHPLWVFL